MSSISREEVATRFMKTAASTNQAWQNFQANVLRLYTAFSTALAFIAIMALVGITHEGIWLSIGTACLAIAVLVTAREMEDSRTVIIKVLTLCVFVSALNYLFWRLWAINWDAWWLGVPLFAAEFFGMLHTLGLQYTVWPRPEAAIGEDEDPTGRPIFIFIPTVNEGPAILIKTIRGALRARERYLAVYPHGKVTIVICNDGYVANAPGWEEAEYIASSLKIRCVTRKVGGGAKAGNLENARHEVDATGDALIVIFDADQIAKADFLLKTIPPFADSRIGWVQTGQYYRNLDNAVSRWANDQQALFYKVICPNKSRQNSAFICGTNVVLRAEALDEIGGLPQDSVTEDFAASIVLHSHWRSIFLPDVLATGLGPMTLNSYLRQQNRWAIGTLSVFKTNWQRILLPWRRDLTMHQRIQYALACTHYLCGLRDVIFILAPIIFLLTNIPAVKGAGLEEFLQHFLPYWIVSQIAFWYVAWGKTSIRGILIGFGSFFVLLGSLLTVITGRRVGFTVTSKTRTADNVLRTLRPHLAVFFLCILAVIVGFSRPLPATQQGKTLVSVFWAVYSICLLSGMLWLGYKDLRQDTVKQPARQAIAAPEFPRFAISAKWAVLLIPLLVGAIALSMTLSRGESALASEAPRFVVSATQGDRTFGLTLSADALKTAPQQVTQEVGAQPEIIGRVQDISDVFDQNWADALAQRGQRPWITLIFHTANSQPYMSSLPAISNGIYDDLLKRWAQSMSDFGRPVYLTILPHVDRNWSLSSAVTNGGIPQDVPRVWQHVRQVFDAEGVKNVAWVWAPADPIHDQIYAPPSFTIDVVLLSLISYPKTAWSNPAQQLAALTQHYPDKPLFVEMSAAGDEPQKAAWLLEVGTAIAQQPTVRGVFYHEGSPDLHPTTSQNKAWSLASDDQSLSAFKDVLLTVGLEVAPTGPAAKPGTSESQLTF